MSTLSMALNMRVVSNCKVPISDICPPCNPKPRESGSIYKYTHCFYLWLTTVCRNPNPHPTCAACSITIQLCHYGVIGKDELSVRVIML